MHRRNLIKQLGLCSIVLTLPKPLSIFTKYNHMNKKDFEVIIIGGSYAGLASAMTLGRSLRKTLVIDAGKPCNRQTPHSHNFLTQDGKAPKEIASVAKSQVQKYETVKFYDGLAISGKKTSTGFEITTSTGDVFTSKKIVLATGIKDIMPNIEGFAECWGISVVHCPYCHGYESKDKKTAFIANGESAFHVASLVNNLTKEITIITQGESDFKEIELEKLEKHRIKINEKEISSIKRTNGQLEEIIFKDGSKEKFDCAYASLGFEQNSKILNELGCKLTEHGHIEVDFMQKTSEYGVFACGDNSTRMRTLSIAVNSGTIAGIMINSELTQESF